MLKFLIILALVFYLVYRVSGFLFKGLFAANHPRRTQSNSKSKIRPSDGNVDVEYTPKDRKGGSFKGGEYVDYEEVD